MRRQIITFLKTAWVVAALAILLMGTNVCVSTDEACFQAGESMLSLMFWLSFPSGLVFATASLVFLGHDTIHYPSDFITAWLVMAAGGLLQWFVVVPRLFAKQHLTVLNLGTIGGSQLSESNIRAKPAVVTPVANQILPEGESTSEVDVRSRRRAIRRRSTKPTTGFDRKGRTPLERVIGHL